MASVFETRLIGNIGRDAVVKKMEKGVIAINFPVAHNKNWKDKKTNELKTKTTWVNCTIWKNEGANLRLLDFLKSGTLVELIGTPYAASFKREDGTTQAEIRLNVAKTNILRGGYSSQQKNLLDEDLSTDLDDFTMDEEEF